jgi:hypothetical protein
LAQCAWLWCSYPTRQTCRTQHQVREISHESLVVRFQYAILHKLAHWHGLKFCEMVWFVLGQNLTEHFVLLP